jgi:hypothetical protein
MLYVLIILAAFETCRSGGHSEDLAKLGRLRGVVGLLLTVLAIGVKGLEEEKQLGAFQSPAFIALLFLRRPVTSMGRVQDFIRASLEAPPTHALSVAGGPARSAGKALFAPPNATCTMRRIPTRPQS